ncbi:YunG family protein [Streptomyces celluloflavus]|uniref:YunG family protein n=1 Tax=Streptomyces celluloflavus TaxID=58344 RepID=UPI0036909ADE
MTPWSLINIDRTFRASWAADTCSPDDDADWQPGNPAWGHCDITALVVHDLFGGDLMLGDMHHAGEPAGYHWWNRLPSGIDIDLTSEQFTVGQLAVHHCWRAPGAPAAEWAATALSRS